MGASSSRQTAGVRRGDLGGAAKDAPRRRPRSQLQRDPASRDASPDSEHSLDGLKANKRQPNDDREPARELEGRAPREEPKNKTVPTTEEDDECAICLECYNEENPKFFTPCMHQYHLQCILEWSTRNKTCPICGREANCDESSIVQADQLSTKE